MLSTGFTLIPIFYFFEAHSAGHFFSFDAVGHSLHKGVARMRLHINRIKWLHYDKILFKI